MNEFKNENKTEMKKELKSNEVIVDNEVLETQDLGDRFLTTDVTITMTGYSYGSRFNDEADVWAFEEDRSNFQIQMAMFNDKGVQEKHTLRVNVNLSEAELLKMEGKTYKFENVNVYTSKNSNALAYGVDNLGKEITVDKPTFISNSHATINVSNLVTPTKKVDKIRGKRTIKVETATNDTLIQTVFKIGTRLDVKSIKIKDIQIAQLSHLKDKKVLIENIQVFKPLNGSAMYSTETIPKVI